MPLSRTWDSNASCLVDGQLWHSLLSRIIVWLALLSSLTFFFGFHFSCGSWDRMSCYGKLHVRKSAILRAVWKDPIWKKKTLEGFANIVQSLREIKVKEALPMFPVFLAKIEYFDLLTCVGTTDSYLRRHWMDCAHVYTVYTVSEQTHNRRLPGDCKKLSCEVCDRTKESCKAMRRFESSIEWAFDILGALKIN